MVYACGGICTVIPLADVAQFSSALASNVLTDLPLLHFIGRCRSSGGQLSQNPQGPKGPIGRPWASDAPAPVLAGRSMVVEVERCKWPAWQTRSDAVFRRSS